MTENSQKMETDWGINPRMRKKFRLFTERAEPTGETLCELCKIIRKANERHKVARATDMHEIFNRTHYPEEVLPDLPVELLACLCNHCNVNIADARWARIALLREHLTRYGRGRMIEAFEYVRSRTISFNPYVKVYDLFF